MTSQQLSSTRAQRPFARPSPFARLSRFGRLLVGLALVAMTVALPVAPAQAASAGWASFTPLEGKSRDFTSVMQQRPAGFPAAEIRTNSVGGSAVGVQSGTSAFLAPQTPPGKVYGFNRSEHYLNLRPNGLSAAPPSVTTYTFARPTPAGGWTFVLGDIDADEVTISATGAENQPLSPSQLGFRSHFNYCAEGVSPKPSCSRPGNDGTDKPDWNPDTSTLVGKGPDTAGASGWFEPTVALNTLTFTYAQKSGSPVFQTWFSALSHNLTGTITRSDKEDQPIGGVTVDLYDPYGDLVGSTTTDADGQYVFDNQATYTGYRVEVERPDKLTSSTLDRTVDLSQDDRIADFALRAVGPSPASGTVTDDETNEPVEGVTVHLSGPNDLERTTTTLADGSYLFDSLPDGDGYVVTIGVPDGFQDNPTEQTFDAPTDSDDPITGLDFVLLRVPSGLVAGTVTDTVGDPIENVLITITGPSNEIHELRTDGNGRYDLAGLEPGSYTITVTAPDRDKVNGVTSRTVTVPVSGGRFVNRNFQISVPSPAPTYSIDGTVLDPARQPVPGATVSAESAEGGAPQTVMVDDNGNFRVTGLPAGEWDLTVTPPAGYRTSAMQKVTVTDRDRTEIAFTLTPTNEPSSTPTPTASPTPTPSHTPPLSPTPTPSHTPRPTLTPAPSPTQTPAGPTLAATGGPSVRPLLFGLAVALVGSFCLLTVRRRRSGSRSH